MSDGDSLNYVCDGCSLAHLPFDGDDEDTDSDLSNKANTQQYDDSNFECFNRKGLHCIHVNARSLLPKMSEMRIIANRSRAAVIAVSETWLDETVTDQEVKIDGYVITRKDRSRNGGGVCIYTRTNIAFNPRRDLESENLEAVWLEILLPKSKPILVGACYRPPKCSDFLWNFEETVTKVPPGQEVIVLGDINICWNKDTTSLGRSYKQLLNMCNYTQLIKDPTRVTDVSSTCLDHIIVSNTEKVCQSGVIPIGISDHYLTFVSRKVVRGTFNAHNTIKIRSMRNYSVEKLNVLLSEADWSGIIDNDDVDSAWSCFHDIFTNILDTIAPVKEVRIKQRTEEWMTSDILDGINERDSLLQTFKKGNDQTVYKKYCSVRNRVQRDIKRAKANYFQDKIEEYKNNSKKLWSVFKSLGYSKKGSDANVVLEIDGEICSDNSKIANFINTFYTTVASCLVKKLPQATGLYNVASEKFKNFYKSKGIKHNAFVLQPVSCEFVCKELGNLNVAKSTGLDNIPAKFLRDGAAHLCVPITSIINLSIATQKVPCQLKQARIKPLFKKNSRLEVGNYRPVAILSVVSKILEKCVYLQLQQYLKEKQLVYEFQSGFREGFSTDTCLIYLSDYIRSQTAKGNYTGMVLIDMQKAFDTVDHSILCRKLQAMGVASVQWFHSYLTGRQQLVAVNGTKSNYCDIS